MGKIIALSNNKGGVGKTTISTNLAAALAHKKKRTLLIDFDSQGSATNILCQKNSYEIPTMVDVLTEKDTTLDSIIQPTYDKNLFVAPANLKLSDAELRLAGVLVGREFVFKKKLTKELQDQYDYIIIDTSPSLGVLTVNAFTAAQHALIPIDCSPMALNGLSNLLGVIKLVQNDLGSNIEILGFLINKYDKRESISEIVLDLLKQKYSKSIFNTKIRINVKLKEAPAANQTIFQYDPACHGAQDTLALANEFMDKVA